MIKGLKVQLCYLCVISMAVAASSRSGVTTSSDVPKFGRQFISRYSLPDLGDSVCTLTEAAVSLEQNCVDCMKNISSILLTSNGDRMYVGAKSLLLSVDLVECKTLENLPWLGQISAVNCGNRYECGNYITRVLALSADNLIACGTNYGNPEAIIMFPDLTMLEKLVLPRICGQGPSWPSSYIQSDTRLFAGVNEAPGTSAITKFQINSYGQLSAEHAVTTNKQWLDHAEFISSFDHGDFVYFVMRERNRENVYSATISRICKSDPGYDDDQSDIAKLFLTFTKTPLSCEMRLPSGDTLDFGVLSSATYNPVSRHVFATFTQYKDVDIGGYAVCGFSLEEIDTAFSGEYLTYDEEGSQISQPLSSPINCETYRSLYEAHSMYITSATVTQTTEFPLYYQLKKFTSIVSDTVGEFTVLYIGTNAGTVEKLVITPDFQLVLATEFVVADSHVPVTTLQFSNDNKRMLVSSTDETVSRFPVDQCEMHSELDRCIGIRDPHCCWCQTSHACSHISDCSECVNDPVSGRVNTAFGRLTNYEWKRIGTCESTCGAMEQTCTRGELIIQYYKVYPKIEELRRTAENCTYTGPWQPFTPVSDNITVVGKVANEARYSTFENEQLFKILALVFGSLFVISLAIIVFLMFYKAKKSRGGNPCEARKRSNIDRTNSTNIISDKPISYMTGPKKSVESAPMMNNHNSMIMPQDLDKLTTMTNSPYRGHITPEDERLLQVNIRETRDPTENMYSDVHGAATLPRNFGNYPTLDRRNLPQNFSLTMHRPGPQNNFNPQQEYRYAPNMLP